MLYQPACLAAEGRNMHNRLNHFSSILRSQLAEMQSFSGRRPQYTERSELRPQGAHKNINESSDRIIRGRRPQSSNHRLKNSESEKTYSPSTHTDRQSAAAGRNRQHTRDRRSPITHEDHQTAATGRNRHQVAAAGRNRRQIAAAGRNLRQPRPQAAFCVKPRPQAAISTISHRWLRWH